MGKHSGRHAFSRKLEELGYKLAGNQLEDAFVRFKALADRKKHVYDEDIEALVDEEIATAQDRIKLVSLTVIAGTMGPQSATLTLDVDGKHQTAQETGNGPVDATFNCIKRLIPHEAVLELYQVHAVTEGTDAQAEVSVRLADNSGRTVTSRGADGSQVRPWPVAAAFIRPIRFELSLPVGWRRAGATSAGNSTIPGGRSGCAKREAAVLPIMWLPDGGGMTRVAAQILIILDVFFLLFPRNSTMRRP
jgi:hypothetical protein